jgi:ABC-type transport system substrate-binding protein
VKWSSTYGDDVGSHPVGTGAYRLAFWKPSSKMVLEANPNYREEYWDGEPPPGDAKAQALLKQMKGKRLPIVGRIEISIIEETQPRWLSFLNAEMDLMYQVPEEFANQAMPMNKLAKNLERRGIQMEQLPALDYTYAYFNMEDPQIGGYAPEKVALRRAILAFVQRARRDRDHPQGQAVPAQTPYPPGVAGADENFRTTANEYNVPKARALLDMFGYVDRDGDGYREMPDGSPFVLRHNSTPTARDGQIDELWKRSLDDIGIKLDVRKAKWPDLLKEAYAGKLMMWSLGGTASVPDADTALQTLYGPNAGHKGNISRFKLAEFDRLYEKAHVMPTARSARSFTRTWPGWSSLMRRGRSIRTGFAPISGTPGSRATAASRSPARTGGSTSTSNGHESKLGAALLGIFVAFAAQAADPNKVFRMAFEVAETTFDPQKVSDVYSNTIVDTIFDPPLTYDYLARPLKLVPRTLVAMPEVADGGKTYTLRVKPGIYFNDDEAFGGKKRELTAYDYVYSMKRLMDPKLAAPLLSEIEGIILGSEEFIAKARKQNKLDYDAPFEGIKALDKYTFQVKLEHPSHIFIYNFSDCRIACAVAREGRGEVRGRRGLASRGNRSLQAGLLEALVQDRARAQSQLSRGTFRRAARGRRREGNEILARLKGKRLPLVGRVEVYIIEEVQPRWLAFLNGELDLMYAVPNDFAYLAFPNNKLAPNLAKQGIQMEQVAALDLTYAYFNMEDRP